MKASGIKIFFLISAVLLLFGQPLMSDSINEMDTNAQKYFKEKDFAKAIDLWIKILYMYPDNEKIQKKIEMIYEIKQKKDISLQKAKLNYKIARKTLALIHESDNRKVDDPDKLDDRELSRKLSHADKRSNEAINNFIIAYRIDPKDSELSGMREDMERLEREINAEKEKERLSRELRQKYERLKNMANELMKVEKYKEALTNWEEILDFFPDDKLAGEGMRKCKLAIENRLKFEKIIYFLARGKDRFNLKIFKKARLEFVQVLNLDPVNREARDYIERIDEKLEEEKFFEVRKQQAEDFYISGIQNLRDNKFELARENFQGALATVENFRDTKLKLESIDRLRDEFLRKENARKLLRINREFQNGMIALTDSRYKDAILSFGITLSLDKDNILAKKYIQRAKDAQKQVEEERVDENSPYFDIINSLVVSGQKLYKKGKFTDSRKNWEKILKLFPKNRIATEFLLKCDIRLNPGQYKKFSKSIVDEGKKYFEKKNYRAALRKFELIRSISADYPGIQSLVRKARFRVRNKQTRVSRIDAKEINLRYRRAMVFFRKGGKKNIDQAVAQLQWIVKRDSENLKAVITLNKIQSQYRIGSSPVKVSRVNLSPKQLILIQKFYYSGINHYSNNNFKKAIREWRKVLAIDPGHIKAKNNIRKCLIFLGR